MKHMRENIVPVIDRGVFHNYVHVCKQLFCVTQSEAIADNRHLFCEFLTFCKGVEEKERSDGQWRSG